MCTACPEVRRRGAELGGYSVAGILVNLVMPRWRRISPWRTPCSESSCRLVPGASPMRRSSTVTPTWRSAGR